MEVGVVGGVTWLFGHQQGRPRLLHLDREGGLAATEVPLADAELGAASGAEIWLYAPGRGAELPARWLAVDVAEVDAPAPGPVEALALEGPSWATAFAVGSERALLVLGSPEAARLVVLDRRTRAPVGPPRSLPVGMVPQRAFCGARRCGLVAIRDEGGGPARRLVLLATDGVGEAVETPLAPGWIGAVAVDAAGDRVVVAWDDHEGVKARVVAREELAPGEILGAPRGARARPGLALLPGPAGPRLALARSRDWWSAPVEGRGLGAPLAIGGRGALLGAALADGVVWLDIDARVELVSGMHLADTTLAAGFTPASGEPSRRTLLSAPEEVAVHLLTRPGRAAALVVPEGGAGSGPRLYPLRGPCP